MKWLSQSDFFKKMGMIVCGVSMAQAASAMSLLEGEWQVMDSLGNALYVVEVYETGTGSLSGKVIKNQSAPQRCNQCKGDKKSKPVLNMDILSGLMQVPGNPREYGGGALLDVRAGHENKIKAKVSHSNLHIKGIQNKHVNQLWKRVK